MSFKWLTRPLKQIPAGLLNDRIDAEYRELQDWRAQLDAAPQEYLSVECCEEMIGIQARSVWTLLRRLERFRIRLKTEIDFAIPGQRVLFFGPSTFIL